MNYDNLLNNLSYSIDSNKSTCSATMAGRKVFDFIKLTSKLPKGVRADFGALRSKFDSSNAAVNALPSALESIDWSHYSSKVGDPALVADFQAKYGNVQIPRPDDEQSAAINALEAEFKKEVADYLAGSNERISQFEATLAALNAEKPLKDMTVSEYLADKPELRAKLEADIEARSL